MLHDEPPTIWFDDITDITLISAIYYCIVFAMVMSSFILGCIHMYPIDRVLTLANTSDLVVQ